MNVKINAILDEMSEHLNHKQMKKLQSVLSETLTPNGRNTESKDNARMLSSFLDAKKMEGCTSKTIRYYKLTIHKMFQNVNSSFDKLKTEDIRTFLLAYQQLNGCSNTTIDNMRRNLSSFFSWLEDEGMIARNPMRRIHKIRSEKRIKDTISDITVERLRDHCESIRDLAIIDLLYSSGIRVGELVNLNRSNVDFEKRECLVFGKGKKERIVYFDAKTKLHLQEYLDTRNDTNDALFVSLDRPHDRLNISGVEIRLRKLGRELNLNRIHPHKFRRTMATRAINKGMPIEQVQRILGHSQINTTLEYAIVSQENVKLSHQRYID